MSFNKITIVGYLGRDPELRYTPQGTAVCKLSVATTERRKNAAGQPDEHTTWFRVTVWGRQAELANEYLSRGRQVYLEGRLRLEEYNDRDGNPRITPEVNATDIQFLGQRSDTLAQNGKSSEPSALSEEMTGGEEEEEEEEEKAKPAPARLSVKAVRKKENSAKQLVSIEEDDIPF
ncbi:MAG: single-stranded DNA-binding protein [Blastocatellia bacterium]|nr:single-stranded DNA-binding protein [Blastocatellia bacterium]